MGCPNSTSPGKPGAQMFQFWSINSSVSHTTGCPTPADRLSKRHLDASLAEAVWWSLTGLKVHSAFACFCEGKVAVQVWFCLIRTILSSETQIYDTYLDTRIESGNVQTYFFLNEQMLSRKKKQYKSDNVLTLTPGQIENVPRGDDCTCTYRHGIRQRNKQTAVLGAKWQTARQNDKRMKHTDE